MSAAIWLLATCAGVPGPDSTAVVAAAHDLESVALARRYADARGIPAIQVCSVEAPATEDVSLDDFRTRIAGGLDACLDAVGVRARIEAVVLARGLPLRVLVPISGSTARVSLAAALALGDTTTSTGAPLLGRSPGRLVSCGDGIQCFGARWLNPFRSGTFRAGWTLRQNGMVWRPRIVTLLHGRTASDAARLVASATTAEAVGAARGTFLFMQGADPARGVLDPSYRAVMEDLRELGFTDVEEVPFAADLTGRDLASLFVGTAGLGRTIEGNTYAPGSLVDNVTSFGALPENFRAGGEEIQVSIARWVARGVAGVHGTSDEPLNDCFPARSLIAEYASGGTLGEAYFRALPYAYWHNVVLGDPMAAPYATRPRVVIEGVADGDVIEGSRRIELRAEDPLGRTIESLVLYIDGVERARGVGEPMRVCLEAGASQVLAVAQIADERTPETRHRTKGWAALRVASGPGPAGCPEPTDAGAADATDDASASVDAGADDARPAASTDAGAPVVVDSGAASPAPEGCACATADGGRPETLLGLVLVAVASVSRRTRGGVAPRSQRRATPR